MITRVSHATLLVTDQAKAYDFYVNKLGFKVHTDLEMDGPPDANGQPTRYRWLTLNAPEQPDVEIILMPPIGLPPEAEKALRTLLANGMMGAWVFHTRDCRATYEELKAKGVEFRDEPTEKHYGVECILSDGCGNWFSLTQPKEGVPFA